MPLTDIAISMLCLMAFLECGSDPRGLGNF